MVLDPVAHMRHLCLWMDAELLLLGEGDKTRDTLFCHDADIIPYLINFDV